MTSRRTKVLFASLAVAGLLLAGCSKSKKSQVPVTGSTPEATTTTAAVVNGATIPVTMAALSDGSLRAVVEVSIGGGPTVSMILDTGSAGIMASPSAIGPNATPTGQTVQSSLAAGAVTGSLVNASVTIGSTSTTGPIQVQSVTSAPTGLFTNTIQGVVGIGVSEYGQTATTSYFSPLLQMGAPYDSGFTISLPASAASKGALVAGPVSAPSSANSTPLTRNTPGTYPNGAANYAKDVTMCWTVDKGSACGLTDFDTGNPSTVIPTNGGGTSSLASGTNMAMGLPNNGPTVWSFTSGVTPSRNLVIQTNQIPAPTQFNTGIAFFLGKNVGFDLAKGQVSIW